MKREDGPKLCRQRWGQTANVIDILAIQLPFFISENTAIEEAKKKIPKQYWSRTWFVSGSNLEQGLGIAAESEKVRVIVLSAASEIIAKVSGPPTDDKVDKIKNTLLTATPASDI